jgi:hypothetical protein
MKWLTIVSKLFKTFFLKYYETIAEDILRRTRVLGAVGSQLFQGKL